MKKKAFDLQQYAATKQLFKAVADGKSILIYGPPGSGKKRLIDDNKILLKYHTFAYVNIQNRAHVEKLLQRSDVFVANGYYTGEKKLHLPRDDVAEIFLPMSFGYTNELEYEDN